MSWGATGTQQTKSFSSVNLYSQNLLPTCKAFPKETTTCIWFTQRHKVFGFIPKKRHKVCNSAAGGPNAVT